MSKIKEKANHVIDRTLKILSQREMLILPGQLAFFLLLAIVPTITLIAYGASLFHVSIDFVSNFIYKSFGESMVSLVMPIINDIRMTPNFLALICVAFYTASGGASSIIVASNQLYHFDNTSFLKRKIKGIFMIFIMIILVVFLLFVPALGNRIIALVQYVNMNETVTKGIVFFLQITKGPVAWFLVFFLIKIIYTMAPDKSIPSSCTTKGSLFTTFGLVIVTYIYSLYVTYVAHYNILFGGLAHFVVLMMWLYFISYIVVIGIAINAEEYEKRKKLSQ